jgi:flagellar motor switch protein FliM
MADYTFSQAEISVILWCMESMASDFQTGDASTPDFESALAKIESAVTFDKMAPNDIATFAA